MYDILADFDFDYCHGILYRLRVLALVFYDVLFTCYVFSVVCLFPGIYAGFFFSVHFSRIFARTSPLILRSGLFSL